MLAILMIDSLPDPANRKYFLLQRNFSPQNKWWENLHLGSSIYIQPANNQNLLHCRGSDQVLPPGGNLSFLHFQSKELETWNWDCSSKLQSHQLESLSFIITPTFYVAISKFLDPKYTTIALAIACYGNNVGLSDKLQSGTNFKLCF